MGEAVPPFPPIGGALQNLMEERLRSIYGGVWGGKGRGGLKMLSKNTCEGVHLIVKLLALNLKASKFTKNELLRTYFSKILAVF